MRLPDFVYNVANAVAPIDPAESKDLREAVSLDYNAVRESIIHKKKENEKRVEQNKAKAEDEEKEPLLILTLKEKFINFLENPYMRFGMWFLYMIAVPSLKRYLRSIVEEQEQPQQENVFEEFMRFKQAKEKGMF